MAVSKVTLSLALIVIFSAVFAEAALKCYNCKNENKNCEEKDSNVEDCAEDEKFCYIKEIDDGFARGCAIDHKSICGNKDEDKCSTCQKDKCNSASGIASSLALSAVAALLLKAFY